MVAIPHWLFALRDIQIYPACPQEVPHEFLTIQYGVDPEVPHPIAKTP